MRLEALPDATRAMFERAAKIPGLSDSLLIGGTALALQDGHRLSEDLDFVQFGKRLDRKRIEGVIEQLARKSSPKLITSLASRQAFENDGEDIDDFHQDWNVDGVKVTFFCPDRTEELVVLRAANPIRYGTVSIADLETIFKLKAMVLAERTTSRDLFDLWHFIEHRGKSVADIDKLLLSKRPLFNLDARLQMIGGRPFKAADPGFQAVRADAPRDMEDLKARMSDLVREHRRTISAELARHLRGRNSALPPEAPNSRGPEGR